MRHLGSVPLKSQEACMKNLVTAPSDASHTWKKSSEFSQQESNPWPTATLQVFFFSLVAIWPLTAEVWSPVKNFSH